MILTISFIAASYLVGAIPFGVIISKTFYRMDIREHGSKNPGATNVWRVLGALPGVSTLILDTLKGLLPVLIARWMFPGSLLTIVFAGLAAIIGHNWSVFLLGKGGKGVATSAGVFLALLPKQTGLALIAFLIFFLTTKHVSVGSMAAALTLLIVSFFIPTPPILHVLVAVVSVLVLIKHIPNMKRLAKGEEPRVSLG